MFVVTETAAEGCNIFVLSASVFNCHRFLENQRGAEKAAERGQSVLPPTNVRRRCSQPENGLQRRPPELGESAAALHELVQQALTLDALTGDEDQRLDSTCSFC